MSGRYSMRGPLFNVTTVKRRAPREHSRRSPPLRGGLRARIPARHSYLVSHLRRFDRSPARACSRGDSPVTPKRWRPRRRPWPRDIAGTPADISRYSRPEIAFRDSDAISMDASIDIEASRNPRIARSRGLEMDLSKIMLDLHPSRGLEKSFRGYRDGSSRPWIAFRGLSNILNGCPFLDCLEIPEELFPVYRILSYVQRNSQSHARPRCDVSRKSQSYAPHALRSRGGFPIPDASCMQSRRAPALRYLSQDIRAGPRPPIRAAGNQGRFTTFYACCQKSKMIPGAHRISPDIQEDSHPAVRPARNHGGPPGSDTSNQRSRGNRGLPCTSPETMGDAQRPMYFALNRGRLPNSEAGFWGQKRIPSLCRISPGIKEGPQTPTH